VTSTPAWPCLSPRGDGALLRVSVVPNARRTGADGLHDGALRGRLAAPPIDGRANDRLLDWLGDELHCARRSLSLHQGTSSRRKVVAIALPSEEVAQWLQRVLPDAQGALSGDGRTGGAAG